MKRTGLAFITLLLAVVCAFADHVADWRADQAAIEALLQQRRYAEARKASIKLTKHMFDALGTTAADAEILARTVALRAAAEDGLGNVDDTNWYRAVAKALDPLVVLPPMATPLPEPVAALHVGEPPVESSEKVMAPQRLRRRDPERPAIVNALGVAMVELEVAIDVDGVVRQPRVVSSPAPSVSFAALESIKQWRFKPGTKDGKPVPVIFRMTYTFH
ncbi:MAG TPA: energy transducer TonB [Thermoanaerobaculia bacterium]|jgi:TonB family protein|nr:energy transducer TonB [Thermoanaerobaculia bacterium]